MLSVIPRFSGRGAYDTTGTQKPLNPKPPKNQHEKVEMEKPQQPLQTGTGRKLNKSV
jgi:hypothetical protein